MEPMMPRAEATALDDLAFDLVARANHLAGQIQPGVREGIGDLVRSMNCYYSNLIEGHDTHPRDIDAALEEHYSDDEGKRSLQREARAHIEVQRLIDRGCDPDESPASLKYIQWLHREFCERLPEEMLWVENPETGGRTRIIPGEFRDGEVEIGPHVPPPAKVLTRFLERFEEVYDFDRLPKSKAIIAIAASHHRFLWIHPFLDGNGRVARLMAHSMMLRSAAGCSIWSVSRGLARNSVEYKSRLMEADSAREGDLDGRGALSASALERFCDFFLSTAIDQVEFMEELLQPGELLRRMKLYVDDEVSANRLPPRSMLLLREAFIAGELERGRAPEITGYQERRGREILSKLLSKGLLVSQGPRAPVRLGFPLDVVGRWFPQLYPLS
ncbi:MAG: Fic family protein [Gammaproteobacteria bacterium]|nr:Fic family protein [Gammaproteobacteria bacterium]